MCGLGSLLHGFSGQCQAVGAMCVAWGLYFMGSVASVRGLVPCVWPGVSTSWVQWPVSGGWCHVCGLGSLLHGFSGQCQAVGAMCVAWGLYFMGSVASVRGLVPCVWPGVSTSWVQWPVSGGWCHVCDLGSLLHGFSGQCQGVGAMCVTWGLYFMGSVASVRELVPCVWPGVSTSWVQWPVSGSWCHVCGLGSLLHGFSGQCQAVGAMCVTWGLYFMGSVASVRQLVPCV